MEETGREHNISFDTPEHSYLYNLYTVTNSGTQNTWTGNPTIRGKQYNVTKTGLGYTINKNDKSNAKKVVKDFKNEIASVINGSSAVSVSYGISEFGGMNSAANNALKKYFYAYTAGIDALYPSLIDVSAHTWYETIPIIYDGKNCDIKFTFEIVNFFGSKSINVKYTYKNTVDKQCFTFFTANKNELANSIRKYAADTYSGAIADYFSMPINKYVQNKKSVLANLLWDGIQNVGVVGTGSGKKTVKNFIKKGVNKYLECIENTLQVSNNSVSAYGSLNNIINDEGAKDYGIELMSDVETENSTNETGFVDDCLVTAIKKELGLDESAELTQKDLETVEELVLMSGYITDLSGIEQCVNLKHLDLSGNSVSDISAISNLKKLETLDLSGNSVSNLAPLTNLTNLQTLVVKNNLVSDLTGLESLKNITDLDLSFNEITSISSLAGLKELQSLNLTDNNISDITPLQQCTGLKVLYLGRNYISDITPINNIALEKLNLAKNNITSLKMLNTSGLTALDVSENNISDISVLCNATGMTDLNIAGNNISDLTAVSDMTMLVKLNFGSNNIYDIAFLQELKKLEELNCSNNYIAEFTIISNLVRLTNLDISNNSVSDFSFIASLTNIKKLAASGCNLYSSDMEYIPHSVVKLDLSCNSISDISTLAGLENSNEINLSNNYVTDIMAFADSTCDLKLNIKGNNISSEQVNALYDAMVDSQYYINIENDLPDIALEDIYFTNDSVSIRIGEEFVQEASVMPYNAITDDLIWSSSIDYVAEVNSDGVVTGKAPGEVTITATNRTGEIKASYNVIVLEDMLENLSVNNNTVSLTLKNTTDKEYDSVVLIVGVYDDNEIMSTMKVVPVNDFVVGYSDYIEVSFDEINPKSKIKLFLWSSLESLQSLTNVKEIIETASDL